MMGVRYHRDMAITIMGMNTTDTELGFAGNLLYAEK
jgi:hypothetical protein